VDAAAFQAADGVVLSAAEVRIQHSGSERTSALRTPQSTVRSGSENHPVRRSKDDRLPPLLRKEGSFRRRPYTSIEDLIARVPGINKREIRSLSLAGALNFDNTIHRREALWQSELIIQPKGSLFENVESRMQNTESDPNSTFEIRHSNFLKRMHGLELVEADLKKTGISIGKHPMAFVRDELSKRGILSAAEARDLKKNQIVSIGGAVIIRQRPMTAKNVVFMTLEDETGHSNFVVMPDTFEKYRAVINQNDYLIIKGIFEERGMLKAITFTPINDYFTAEVVSHNFR
jgi:error-prone DNA polymerase